MKFLFLFLTFLLAGCNSKKTEDHFNRPIEKRPLAANQIENLSEEEVLNLAKESLLKRNALTTKIAEKCWASEIRRGKVRNACLLLWSIGTERSAILEDSVIRKINEPFYSSLLIFRPYLIERLSYAQAIESLKSLKENSTWVKVKILKNWLKSHGNTLNREQLTNIIPIAIDNMDDSPISTYETGTLLKNIEPSRWSSLFQNFCNLNVEGDQKLRCWRFISLFHSEIEAESEWRNLFIPFIPKFSDPTWILFSRNFPNQARKIQISLLP